MAPLYHDFLSQELDMRRHLRRRGSFVEELTVVSAAVPVGPATLLNLDFTSPTSTLIPFTPESAQAIFGQTPDFLLNFEETAAPLVDAVTSGTIPNLSAGSTRYRQQALGLFTASFEAKNCVTVAKDSLHRWRASATPMGNASATDSYAVLAVFRAGPGTYNNGGVGAFYCYWKKGGVQLNIQPSVGGVNAAYGYFVHGTRGAYTAKPVIDGSWHYMFGRADRARNVVEMFSDVSGSTGGTVNAGAITNLDVEIGRGVNNDTAVSLAFVAVWTGSKCEDSNLPFTTIENWWNVGRPPANLDTYSRASYTSTVSGSKVFHYSGNSTQNQMPYTSHANLTNANKIGCQIEPGTTNLLVYSNDFVFANWVKTNTTCIDQHWHRTAGPDNFWAGDDVDVTAANGTIHQAVTTTANTDLSLQFWVEFTNGTSGAGRLILDNGSAIIGATSFTASSTPQQVKLEGVQHTGTLSNFKIEFAENGAAFQVWMAQMEYSSRCTTYTHSTTSQAARLAPTIQVDSVLAAPVQVSSAQGEISATAVMFDIVGPATSSANRNVVEVGNSTNNKDRIVVQLDDIANGSKGRVYVYDDNGAQRNAIATNFVDPTDEIEYRVRWDKDGTVPSHNVTFDGFVATERFDDGDASAITIGNQPANALNIGHNRTGAATIAGIIVDVTVYESERDDEP